MASRSVRQFVTFSLMGEEYALLIQHVREIIQFEPITSIPSMPPVVRGVMSLRGMVVPVIDLPVKFGLPPTSLGGTYLVVVDLVWNGEAVRLALVTPELGRVVEVAEEEVNAVPDFGTRIQSEYLRGMAQVDGRFVLFLDAERLLSAAELLKITALDGRAPVAGAAKVERASGQVGEG